MLNKIAEDIAKDMAKDLDKSIYKTPFFGIDPAKPGAENTGYAMFQELGRKPKESGDDFYTRIIKNTRKAGEDLRNHVNNGGTIKEFMEGKPKKKKSFFEKLFNKN